MKIKYIGEIEVVCREMVWKPGEEKELGDDLGALLVETNHNFVPAGEVGE